MTETERATRRNRIDPKLDAAGWPVVDISRPGRPGAVVEFPTAVGPADYALVNQGAVRGVVEAKRVGTGPQGVLPQAERYARAVDQQPRYQDEFGVPFLYSSNGTQIWFRDVRHELNRSRLVSGFHSPEALEELLERDVAAELAALADAPMNEMMRPYQVEASQAIEGALLQRRRNLLVAMATGTGKTYTIVNQIYRLMKAGVARRVLFLVDRRALAAQAASTFASFTAEPGQKSHQIYPVYSQRIQRSDLAEGQTWDPNLLPDSRLEHPKLGDAFVFVCTIQRLARQLFGGAGALPTDDEPTDDDVSRLDIPIHAFDLIVADECHRGYSARELSVWRDTLDHFDAVTIGLTATPAAHTTAYFGAPVFTYSFERAVRERFLVDYDAVRLHSNVRMNGVFLRKGEQVDEIDPTTGARTLDLLDDERTFDAADVERRITAPDSNRRILAELRRYADEHEREFGRFPKTLIFAANDLPHRSHADQLVELAREIFGRGDGFVTKITGRVDRPLQRIREFRNRPKPGIAVTVDLLTTGVDIPDLEFIVFLRPVKSRILFAQMLGRGTRLGEHHPDKTHFTVFDCFDGTLLDYFRQTTDLTLDPPGGDGKPLPAIVEEIWRNVDRDRNVRRLVSRLQRVDRRMTGDARELFARFIPDGDVGRFAENLAARLRADFTGTMAILRDPDFQKLLADYPKGHTPFLVAPGVTDEVSSQWLIRGGTGREYQPAEYLAAFEEFVRTHRDDVDALAILLSRPREWGSGPLAALRAALTAAPEHFTEANLQRAFQVTDRKALADIISMVKRAARAGSPLLTSQERVNQAVERVLSGLPEPLTEQQAGWLEHIRRHLVANLSVDREDFDAIPVLSDHGGWRRADRVFGGRLADLVSRLNEELAAA